MIDLPFIPKRDIEKYVLRTWQSRFLGPSECSRLQSQIAKFMEPTWGPHGSCRPQMGPMLAPGTLLSGVCYPHVSITGRLLVSGGWPLCGSRPFHPGLRFPRHLVSQWHWYRPAARHRQELPLPLLQYIPVRLHGPHVYHNQHDDTAHPRTICKDIRILLLMSHTLNWPNSQIPECSWSISHNAPFRTEMCTFLFWMEHYGIWN